MTYCGIDIGNTGGVAFLGAPAGSVPFGVARLPLQSTGKRQEVDVLTLWDLLVKSGPNELTVVVEECSHHQPSQSAMRSQALSFGKILGLLETRRVKTIIVTPKKWQGYLFGKIPKGTTKQAALGLARRLWPTESFIPDGCRVTSDGLIDASLIAEWARRNSL